MMTTVELNAWLVKHNACLAARDWVLAHADATPEYLWACCPNGAWMLWLAVRAGVDRRLIVAAACRCARLTLDLVPVAEPRPRLAIETAERWVRGEATGEECRQAAYAAYTAAEAAYAAEAAEAACAAYATAYAADAADAADAAEASYAGEASYATAYAAEAADAACAVAEAASASGAFADSDDDARIEMRGRCADEVRKVISCADWRMS